MSWMILGYNSERKRVKIMIVGIIGAGASGMAAAITAAKNPNIQVTLFERQARVGKKLLATGNGRCNLTNLNACNGGYHGDDAAFARNALDNLSPEKTLEWFRGLGLYTVTERSGRVYPYSDQANSVVDVLRFALNKPNITLHTGFDVKKIRKLQEGFMVDDGQMQVYCDRIVIACGGLAGTKLGGSMSGYKLLSKFGHKSTKLRPALVQLKTTWGGVTALKGVRCNCHVMVLRDGSLFTQSTGELQFTDYGLSGPVIFEVSRDACYGGGEWNARLDFLPGMAQDELLAEMKRRQATELIAEEILTGILHNRLGRVITKASGIQNQMPISDLTEQELLLLCETVKAFEIPLSEPMGMEQAQVTAGGVATSEFNPETMESKLVAGLYACGEVLDIDGDCGGYNLQWAWSSGVLAGQNAGKGT